MLENLLDVWAVLGFVAQLLFTGRFLVQWIASERQGRSVVPVSFWYLSVAGSTGLLVYSIVKCEPVFILAYLFNNVIYLRNLTLVYRERKQAAHKTS